jgi:hypothetical protein
VEDVAGLRVEMVAFDHCRLSADDQRSPILMKKGMQIAKEDTRGQQNMPMKQSR